MRSTNRFSRAFNAVVTCHQATMDAMLHAHYKIKRRRSRYASAAVLAKASETKPT